MSALVTKSLAHIPNGAGFEACIDDAADLLLHNGRCSFGKISAVGLSNGGVLVHLSVLFLVVAEARCIEHAWMAWNGCHGYCFLQRSGKIQERLEKRGETPRSKTSRRGQTETNLRRSF